MVRQRFGLVFGFVAALALAGCGGGSGFGSIGGLGDSLGGSSGSGPFSGGGRTQTTEDGTAIDTRATGHAVEIPNGETIVVEQRKARTILGWEPRVDLDTGLRQTLEYFRAKLGLEEHLDV